MSTNRSCLSPSKGLKGSYSAKSTFTWCLDINVCWQCVHTTKSNQIKSLLLSHHHSTSALVSEILMSVLQTVQKNNNRQFTYGQTVQKTALEHLQCSRQCKKKQQQFTYGQTVQKSNSNLHMDSTYLQTVQKTMCKIHIHILSTQCTIKTYLIINDTLYTVWAHLHYVQYLYIM